MRRRPPRSTRTDTLFPYTTLFRSVDLDLRGVGAEEGIIDLAGEPLRLLGEIAGEPERACDRAAVMRHEAGRGIDVEGVAYLRAVVRDGFDIHHALGRDDERYAAGDADRKSYVWGTRLTKHEDIGGRRKIK